MRRLVIILFITSFGFLYVPNLFASEKLISLTFDDGPRPHVLKNLLPLLKQYSVPATFFMIGAEILPNGKFVKDMSESGYEIENHSWGHENFLKLYREKGAAAVSLSLAKTNNLIFKVTGKKPKFFRPPFWEINGDVEKVVRDLNLTPMKLDNPDINTMDYADFSNHRPVEVLISRVRKSIEQREKQNFYSHVLTFHELPLTVDALKVLIPYLQGRGYKFVRLNETMAVYLSIDNLYNQKKIEYIFSLFDGTELNAVVIDFKVDKLQTNQYVRDLIARFHQKGIYVIGRLVMFQDSYLAKTRPHLAIRNKNGEMCFSGRKFWQRHWVDMASEEVINYNIEIAKSGIDLGFDEINFDYIRFPSDLKNCNLRNDIIYPVWDGKDRYLVMRKVFAAIKEQLKNHAGKNNTSVILSIDIYGEVFAYGAEPGIGQKLSDIAEFFDVISPMAYPSHYKCGEFGLKDPNANSYVVYNETLESGLKQLQGIGFKGGVRPWIQDFSIANIYGCGPVVYYGEKEVRAQIKASQGLGINGFMFWNAANNYTKKALLW